MLSTSYVNNSWGSQYNKHVTSLRHDFRKIYSHRQIRDLILMSLTFKIHSTKDPIYMCNKKKGKKKHLFLNMTNGTSYLSLEK